MKTASMTLVKRALSAAILSSLAFGATAATYNLGALTAGGPPKSFNAFHAGAGLTAFEDYFTFTLATPTLTSGSVIDFAIPGFTGSSFSMASLMSGTPGAPGSTYATATGDASGLAFTSVLTPAGSYFFKVNGVVTDGVSLGAAYSGAINVVAAPVPEPESYAMLLAGLGVMGAIAVRRNKAKKQD